MSNLLILLRDYVAEQYDKNIHYDALETQEERDAFLDAIINNMPMTEVLEQLSWAMSEKLRA